MKIYECEKCGYSHQSDILRSGDVTIDGKRVYLKGEEVRLTSTELALLQFLMVNAGHVFPADEITDHVWGDFDQETNVVRTYIGYIRRKLGKNIIQTRGGIGYFVEKDQK